MTYVIEIFDRDSKEFIDSDVELSETEILKILREKIPTSEFDYGDFDFWEV